MVFCPEHPKWDPWVVHIAFLLHAFLRDAYLRDAFLGDAF